MTEFEDAFDSFFLVAGVCGCVLFNLAQKAGLAATPPMGWNSWNHFKVRWTMRRWAAAEAMVSSGMRDAGYVYVNIDDTWEGERDAQGRIQANSKFPDMKGLADFVHSEGFEAGDLFFAWRSHVC